MPMTSQMRAAFLHHHNSLRSQVAMGHVRGYPPATRMATMSWSDELANLAALNTYQCEIEHDQCRATLAFRTPGQNLCTRSGPYETLHGVINRCINAWFEEKTIAKPSYVDYLVVEPHFKQYGHFTQMVVDKAYKVGCAVVRSPSSYYGKRYFLACNYSASQVIGRPLYVRGKTGKYCSTGRNAYYPGLCNPSESFPSN
ncbi:antigen 5 like allergen Cul n 1-like [Condylostylus longicornis]|uniref:antigen 5 like allergen Cul n 1-like n=1 Tax=Condylostylus longicornis TaxID=2530218 RepID=UPI00244E1672|nr:antigen 5 like allergen Cul n 1-like [Condylostylus longicornis]